MSAAPDAANAPQVAFVEIDGVNLRYAVQAGRVGRPLLIFNGIGANLEVVFPFMAALAGIECIVFDVPGIGGSEMSWRPRRFSGLARLARRLLDRLGYREVDVAGVSWGGAVAQQFAHQYPQRCGRLVLAATSAGALMIPGRPGVLLKMVTPRRYLSRDYLRTAAADLYGGELRRNPDLIGAHANRIIPPRFMGYVYQLLAGSGWTSVWWLHRLRQPTLVLGGSDDPLVPIANARFLAWLIPNSTLHVVQGGGHLFMLHSLDRVGPLIRRFLRPKGRPD